jgi:hypothetical protein
MFTAAGIFCWTAVGIDESTKVLKAVAFRFGGLVGHSLIMYPSVLQ